MSSTPTRSSSGSTSRGWRRCRTWMMTTCTRSPRMPCRSWREGSPRGSSRTRWAWTTSTWGRRARARPGRSGTCRAGGRVGRWRRPGSASAQVVVEGQLHRDTRAERGGRRWEGGRLSHRRLGRVAQDVVRTGAHDGQLEQLAPGSDGDAQREAPFDSGHGGLVRVAHVLEAVPEHHLEVLLFPGGELLAGGRRVRDGEQPRAAGGEDAVHHAADDSSRHAPGDAAWRGHGAGLDGGVWSGGLRWSGRFGSWERPRLLRGPGEGPG